MATRRSISSLILAVTTKTQPSGSRFLSGPIFSSSPSCGRPQIQRLFPTTTEFRSPTSYPRAYSSNQAFNNVEEAARAKPERALMVISEPEKSVVLWKQKVDVLAAGIIKQSEAFNNVEEATRAKQSEDRKKNTFWRDFVNIVQRHFRAIELIYLKAKLIILLFNEPVGFIILVTITYNSVRILALDWIDILVVREYRKELCEELKAAHKSYSGGQQASQFEGAIY